MSRCWGLAFLTVSACATQSQQQAVQPEPAMDAELVFQHPPLGGRGLREASEGANALVRLELPIANAAEAETGLEKALGHPVEVRDVLERDADIVLSTAPRTVYFDGVALSGRFWSGFLIDRRTGTVHHFEYLPRRGGYCIVNGR
jgi:hypothetical protein